MTQRVEVGQACNGALSMAGALLVAQPLFTAKTYSMLGLGSPPWRRLWSGYGANVVCSAPAEAIAFVTYDLFLHMHDPTEQDPTPLQNFSASIFAGIVSSPTNAMCEQIMIRQQAHGQTALSHMTHIYNSCGWKGLFRGSLATAGRDAIFTCGLFALNDAINHELSPIFQEQTLRNTIASIASGALSGFLSTPLDLGKTIVQEQGHGTTSQVLLDLLKQNGVQAIFKGALFRSATAATLICAMSHLKTELSKHLLE